MDAEHGNLGKSVQRCLHQNGSGGAACSHQGHFFSGQVVAGISGRLHISDPVCGMTGEYTVLIDHGIHRSGDLSGRGQPVAERTHQVFVRHGQVETADIQGAQPFDRGFQLVRAYVKGKIDIIQPELFKCFIVHHRRDAVCDRASQKPGQSGVSCDLFHDPVLLF